MSNEDLTMWSREAMWQIKNVLFFKVYGYETWQGNDLWLGELTHDVTRTPDNVFMWGHVTKWKLSISSSTTPIISKLWKLWWGKVTHNTTWRSVQKSREVTWQKKNISFSTTSMTTKLGRIVTWEEITHNVTRPPEHVVTWGNVTNKNKISLLLRSLWPANLTRWWLMMKGNHAWSGMIL